MIEINLLPPQYRVVERTPLPIFLGLIGAILVAAAAIIFLMTLVNKGQRLAESKQNYQAEKERKEKEVADIRKIEKDLQESKGRIDTVLSIAESKNYWGMKLDQLARTLPRDVWIEGLTMDGSRMSISCKARGTGYQRYTALRQRFRDDSNFIYHFGDMQLTPVDIVTPGTKYLEPKVLSFNIPLTMRPADQLGAPAPRR